jgi:F-type H+-transporting ATPase subunit gamma
VSGSGEAARAVGISLKEAEAEEARREVWHRQVDYIYEQPPEEIFADLLPKYVAFQIFEALLESVAAEMPRA